MPVLHKRYCTSLKDDLIIGLKSVRGENPIAPLLHDIIREDLAAIFSFQVDFRHFATVSMYTRFTYWLCDCLHRFEGCLKMTGRGNMGLMLQATYR